MLIIANEKKSVSAPQVYSDGSYSEKTSRLMSVDINQSGNVMFALSLSGHSALLATYHSITDQTWKTFCTHLTNIDSAADLQNKSCWYLAFWDYWHWWIMNRTYAWFSKKKKIQWNSVKTKSLLNFSNFVYITYEHS